MVANATEPREDSELLVLSSTNALQQQKRDVRSKMIYRIIHNGNHSPNAR